MSTDDSPDREFDLPSATLERTSNLYESEDIPYHLNPTVNPRLSQIPRREVWWLKQDATNHSLMSIGRCFEDRLKWSLLSSSNSPLPRLHIRPPRNDIFIVNLHRCPGYLREEITLTCDLSKSVIVSHVFPGPSERCSICHQLVPYPTTVSDHAALTIVVANYDANCKSLVINGGNFVTNCLPNSIMQAAPESERNPSVSYLVHSLFAAFCWWSADSAFWFHSGAEYTHQWRRFLFLHWHSRPLLIMICRLRILAHISFRGRISMAVLFLHWHSKSSYGIRKNEIPLWVA